MDKFEKALTTYVKASIPVLSVATYEWQRLHGFCVGAAMEHDLVLYKWSVVSGLDKWGKGESTFICEDNEKKDPIDILSWFENAEQSHCILLLEDFHPFMTSENYQIVRFIREITRINSNQQKILIIQTPYIVNLRELEKEVPILELELPKENILRTILNNVLDELAYDDKPNDDNEIKDIVSASLGMSSVEAEWTYKKIIAERERLTISEITLIVNEKEQIIKKEGILEYFHPDSDFNQVGGMESLKKWLNKRGKAFSNDAKDFGLTSPKGVMLLGVPGCGKSLIAKTIANEWNLPLLKFDLGKVFGGIVGESESNIRKALSLAETIAPSILWIDEIEKGLSGINGGGDSGTSARVFGNLLTWMQEKKSEVFVIATANNIEQLPPELLRKGRFDEIFFVDLPSKEERKDIFKIHIERKKRDVRLFDIDNLAAESIGFSGAEIEEAVNEGLFIAYAQSQDLSTENIFEALKSTYPLSKTMKHTIEDLRKWAKVRARFASSQETDELPEIQDAEKVPQLKQEKHNPFI
ncbi:MAG: AAA family ATPase [Spirochaetales bacterium]|nr:AAA family ATPase [Spirochaetales bacterium]